MPRLPSTSWAPRPILVCRTWVFTVRNSGSWARAGAAGTSGTGRRGARWGSQKPGQVAVQTRSRSTWIRPTRSTAVDATAYVYQIDRQWRDRVSHSGTGRSAGLQDVVPDGEPRHDATDGEERRADDQSRAVARGEDGGMVVVGAGEPDRDRERRDRQQLCGPRHGVVLAAGDPGHGVRCRTQDGRRQRGDRRRHAQARRRRAGRGRGPV